MKPKESVRDVLRAETRKAHDRLDRLMRQTGWKDRTSYALFLQVQFAARRPAEQCFGRLVAETDTLPPPAQAGLIQQDLDTLGVRVSSAKLPVFTLPDGADPIGAYWAIAGSSLGNKAILKEVERVPGGAAWPRAFLSDDSMTAFWAKLRQELSQLSSDRAAKEAVLAANAVFDHFHQTAEQFLCEQAA